MPAFYRPSTPGNLVCIAAEADYWGCKQLAKQLKPLQQQNLCVYWSVQDVSPGADWQQQIDRHIAQASIIVLLLSPDFFNDNMCMDVMQKSLERQKQGITILPTHLRPVDLEFTSFPKSSCLPRDERPITLHSNRDAAFLEIAEWIGARITGSPLPLAKPRLYPPADKHIQAFLSYLSTFYQDKREKSLHGNALIPLELHSQPGSVSQVADLIFRHLDYSEQAIPLGTPILHIYDKAAGQLLILGEPGAGKSLMLLQLASELVQQAQQDAQRLLPVILNLSSWSEKRLSLAEWLIEELWVHYHVPRQRGRKWVEQEQILPMLDGLDEMPLSAHIACINAINTYQREKQVPLVVCSRKQEYSLLKSRLALQCALDIRPLTPTQIDHSLPTGPELAAVRTVLQQNDVLRELATSPFMLNILIITYRNADIRTLPQKGSIEEQRRQVFDRYIDYTYTLDPNERFQSIPQQQMREYLTWLAQQMQQHTQSIFYLERLQPSWLSSNQLRIYNWLAVRLPAMLIGSFVVLSILMSFLDQPFVPDNFPFIVELLLTGGLLGSLINTRNNISSPTEKKKSYLGSHFVPWLLIAISIGLIIGLLYASPSGIVFGFSEFLSWMICTFLLQALLDNRNAIASPPENLTIWQYLRGGREVFNGVLVGIIVILMFGLLYSHKPGFVSGLKLGLFYGPDYSISYILLLLLIVRDITVRLTDRFEWSWRNFGKSLYSKQHLRITFWVIAVNFLLDGLGAALYYQNLDAWLDTGLSFSLSFGLFYWLLFGVIQGGRSETIDDKKRLIPNQGITHSGKNALRLGLFSFVIVELSGSIGYALNHTLGYVLKFLQGDPLPDSLIALFFSGIRTWWVNEWLIGFLIATVVMLLNGGLAYLRHFILRFLLQHAKSIPSNFVPVLDEASRRILLFKSGGGYTFIHLLFRDYVADLDKRQPIK